MSGKEIIYMVVVFLWFLFILGDASALSKGDFVQLVENHADLSGAYTTYRVCNPTGVDYTISDEARFNVTFKESRNRLRNYRFTALKNVSRVETINTYTSQTSYYNHTYLDNSTGLNKTELRNLTTRVVNSTYNITRYQEEWTVFNPLGASFKANTCSLIKIEGTYPANKETSIDNVLGFAGYSYSEYAWWNTSYNYTRKITITNNNPTSVLEKGYSMSISLNHSELVELNKSQAQGSDVRVVWWNGSENIELDRVNTTGFNNRSQNVTVWFNLQRNISAAGIDNDYSLYYGNPSAGSPPANGSNVYLFYDDFSDLDYTNNTTWSTGIGSWVMNTHYVESVPTGDDNLYTSSVTATNAVWEFKMKLVNPSSTGTSPDASLVIISTVTGSNADMHANSISAGLNSQNVLLNKGNGGGWSNITSGTWTEDTSWHTLKVIRNDTEWELFFDDVSKGTGSQAGFATSSYIQAYDRGSGSAYDDIKVRKYLSPEPTASLSGETSIQLTGNTVSPASGVHGTSFNFTVNITNQAGQETNVTLHVLDATQAEVYNKTVNLNDSASLISGKAQAIVTVQLNQTGQYSYYWHANSTTASTATAILSGPVVYHSNYEKTFNVSAGVNKLIAGVHWYGLSSASTATISLSNGTATYGEFNVPTLIREFESVDVILPLVNYNLTIHSGYRELSINNPAPGNWTLRVIHNNATRIETDVRWM